MIRGIKRSNYTMSKEIKFKHKKTELILTFAVILLFLNFVNLINAQWTNIEETQSALRPSFYSPVLRVKSTEGYLLESSIPGTSVRLKPTTISETFQIFVDDKDLIPGMPPAIYQYIITGYGAEKFAVDERGNLYLNSGTLDTDRSSSVYQFHVIAREVDTEPIRSSEPISITIYIIDENDNAPMFPQTLYFVNVSAYGINNIERTILKLKAIDEDTGEFGRIVTYRIVDVSDGAIRSFKYDIPTNELRVIDSLMPEHNYKIILEAEDGGGLLGQTTIIVHATESSLNVPFLAPQNFGISSQNIAAPFQQIGNWPQNSNAQNYLNELLAAANRVSSTSKEQTLSVPLQNNALENQQKQSFSLTPRNQEPSSLTALNTFNKQITPINNIRSEHLLNQQTIVTELNEATPQNSIVYVLGDEESQNLIYFRIVNGNEAGKFKINIDSGTISTAKLVDREEIDSYILKIEARSRQPDQLLYLTNLIINVTDSNDNAPKFHAASPKFFNLKLNENNLAIPFNLPIGRIIVNDADKGKNGQILLKILPPMNKLFTISFNGELSINGKFTNEHFGERRLTVVASDHGNPPRESRVHIIINIQGSNSQQKLINNVDVSKYALAPLGGLNGDKNNEIQFFGSSSNSKSSSSENIGQLNGASALFSRATLPSLYSSTESPFTIVNSSNFLATLPPLLQNNNLNGAISFNQLHSETSSITKNNISLNSVNEINSSKRYFAPVFTVPILNLEVVENESDLELCTVEAKFPEKLPKNWNYTISYIIESGDESLFEINQQTGKIILLKSFDAEKQKNYKLQIGTLQATQDNLFVTSNALAHSANIIIHVVDVNDFIPSFEQNTYVFQLSDQATTGTVIGQVTAYDQDAEAPNNKITYRILDKSENKNFFEIDSNTGLIKLIRNLDEYSKQNFTLELEAVDGGEISQITKAQAIIEIQPTKLLNLISTTNKEHLKIKQNNINIKEKAAKNNKSVENKSILSDKIILNSSDISLTDSLEAVNFVSKNYSAKIMEKVRAPALVTRLPIQFNNKGLNARFLICAIESGNLDGLFRVSPSKKLDACELHTEVELDREKKDNYILNVSLTFGSTTDFALVAIEVTDVNDNSPYFLFSKATNENNEENELIDGYFAVVPSLAPAETHVIKIKAVDVDTEKNSFVWYDFDNATYGDASYFTIQQDSGDILTKKQMPEAASSKNSGKNTKTFFDFWVKACDSPNYGSRSLCSKARVLVNLIGNQHRFITVFRNTSIKKIKNKELDIANAMRRFTDPCTFLRIEKIDDELHKTNEFKTLNDNNDEMQQNKIKPNIEIYWYAANQLNKRICRKKEFRKLFTISTRELLTVNLKKNFLLELNEIRDEINQSTILTIENNYLADQFFAMFEWHTTSGVLILCFFAFGIAALFVFCLICASRIRHKKKAKRRNVKRQTYPSGIYPISKYGLNGNPSVYLPTISGNGCTATFPSGPVFGTLEKDKFYETQMLELPINDENFNLIHNKHFNSRGSPSSAWSKSLVNGTQRFQHNYRQQVYNNQLFNNNSNNNISSNQNFFHVNEEYRSINGNRNNNIYLHNHPQFIYGTTTTTSSHGVGGNGSGIPTNNGLITGRGTSAKANKALNQFRNISSTREEDSLGEFSVDDESISQHNNINKETSQNSK